MRRSKLFNDRRAHNIDLLRYCIDVYDWKPIMCCYNIQFVYENEIKNVNVTFNQKPTGSQFSLLNEPN